MNIECATFQDLLTDALDGGLAAERQAQFDAHLHECPDCVRRMKDLVVVKVAARAARESSEESFAALPERLVARIVSALRARGAEGPGAARA